MTNVMIVEDQTMPRQLFELFVNSSPNYNLVYSIDNASYAELYCSTGKIDLILMDIITAKEENGLIVAQKIKLRYPQIKIIIVTSMPEYSYIKRAKSAGIDSFWYKEVCKEPILEIMDRTMAGESIYPNTTPRLIIGETTSYDLTESELAVLKELTSGDPNTVIAQRMHLSINTIKTHIQRMLDKTGFHSRTELAVKARQIGLVILDKDDN